MAGDTSERLMEKPDLPDTAEHRARDFAIECDKLKAERDHLAKQVEQLEGERDTATKYLDRSICECGALKAERDQLREANAKMRTTIGLLFGKCDCHPGRYYCATCEIGDRARDALSSQPDAALKPVDTEVKT